MASEKRKFTRIPLPFELTLILEDGSSHKVNHFDNVSVGGCLVSLQPEYADHTTCTVKIELGQDQEQEPTILAHGNIIRHNDHQLAIQFTSIDPDSLFHLQNLIRYNSPDPDKVDSEIQLHKGIL